MSRAEITVTVSEEQRQALVLALAHLAVERPGWDWFLGTLADTLQGATLYTLGKATAPAAHREAARTGHTSPMTRLAQQLGVELPAYRPVTVQALQDVRPAAAPPSEAQGPVPSAEEERGGGQSEGAIFLALQLPQGLEE